MAVEIPEFDFESYNAQDPWHFPGQRLVRVAAELYHLASAARQRTQRNYLHPDQRFVVFHELAAQGHALLIGAMHLRSDGLSPAWWAAQPELTHTVDTRLMAANNMNVRHLLHLGYAEGLLRQLDMALRQYHAALGGPEGSRAGLGKVWRAVQAACGLPTDDRLLRLLQIHRDGLSQLGKFWAADGQDLTIQFGGRTWAFAHRAEIDYRAMGFVDDWDCLKWLAADAIAFLEAVHGAPALIAAGAVMPRHLS